MFWTRSNGIPVPGVGDGNDDGVVVEPCGDLSSGEFGFRTSGLGGEAEAAREAEPSAEKSENETETSGSRTLDAGRINRQAAQYARNLHSLLPPTFFLWSLGPLKKPLKVEEVRAYEGLGPWVQGWCCAAGGCWRPLSAPFSTDDGGTDGPLPHRDERGSLLELGEAWHWQGIGRAWSEQASYKRTRTVCKTATPQPTCLRSAYEVPPRRSSSALVAQDGAITARYFTWAFDLAGNT
ncbi:hypothetical protein EG329_000486 [Mollisiaceae sp. DMI_Dod_QoI]|nr:hypothetical protein EG329_000486 [Helotiales sp. DMI_Dod_QoI]